MYCLTTSSLSAYLIELIEAGGELVLHSLHISYPFILAPLRSPLANVSASSRLADTYSKSLPIITSWLLLKQILSTNPVSSVKLLIRSCIVCSCHIFSIVSPLLGIEFLLNIPSDCALFGDIVCRLL